MKDDIIKEFIKESNAIEGVYDEKENKQSLLVWNYLTGNFFLTPKVVLETHHILMQNLLPEYEKGFFRRDYVMVNGRLGIDPDDILSSISRWAERVRDDILGLVDGSNEQKEGILKQRHIEYEKIHPFIDGNGRTGRMFMNWQRLRMGLPILVIKESEKHEYYKWFA